MRRIFLAQRCIVLSAQVNRLGLCICIGMPTNALVSSAALTSNNNNNEWIEIGKYEKEDNYFCHNYRITL